MLRNPAYCRQVTFESLPFFKLYDFRNLQKVREALECLSCQGMPPCFQKIRGKLLPNPHQADNHYREELIRLTHCFYNRQLFFVRAYRLLQNDFFKVEVTLHSGTLGKRKNYDFAKAKRSVVKFFNFLEEDITPLHPLGNHCNDYFFLEQFEKEVSAFEKQLKHLKEAKKRRLRKCLKESFIKNLKTFQKNAKEIAGKILASLKTNKAVCANLKHLR